MVIYTTITFIMKIVALIIWAFLLVCIIYPVEILGVESFCTAHSVPVGETTTISCRFTEDLSISQREVHAYLYKGDTSDSNLVLIYSWINGIPRIQLKQGYDCNSTLTDHLEITIYNVTKEHAGQYRCIVAPSVNHQAHYCILQINEVAFIEAERENTGHVLTITFSILVIVLAILAALLLAYWKRWICKSQRSTSDSDNVDMEQRVALNNPENIDLVNGLRQEQGTAPENETSGFALPDSNPHHS